MSVHILPQNLHWPPIPSNCGWNSQPQGVHVLLVSPGPIAREDRTQRHADKLEGLPARAAKPGAGVRISPVRPEKLSQAILKACRRGQPELIYPPLARLFIAVIQLFPRLGDWLVRKMT